MQLIQMYCKKDMPEVLRFNYRRQAFGLIPEGRISVCMKDSPWTAQFMHYAFDKVTR